MFRKKNHLLNQPSIIDRLFKKMSFIETRECLTKLISI